MKLGTIPRGTISRRRRATTAKKCTKKSDSSATLFAVSVLGTYFECQGVKRIYLNFTLWPCRETFVVQRSRSSPPSMGHTTVENTLAQYKMWKPSHDVHVQRFKDSKERRDWQLLLQVIYLVNNCEAITIFYRATYDFQVHFNQIHTKCSLKTNLCEAKCCFANLILTFSLPLCKTGLHGAMFKNFFLVWRRTKRKVSFYSLSIIRLTDLAEKIWNLICLLLDYEWRSFNIWRHYHCLNLCGSPREILFHLVRR